MLNIFLFVLFFGYLGGKAQIVLNMLIHIYYCLPCYLFGYLVVE